ncbi:MAG: phosphatidylserine decarboxylase proenzyme [marine bacterium B5-7]|nr:MAG: phosphatidylserine decarboxylase proenzyme [marine bacterium B5-7]
MKHSLVAREGWFYILVTLGVALVVTLAGGGWWSVPAWLLFAFVLQFFRDPPRLIPSDIDVVVAPAHGKVVALGEADDPYLKRRARRISIFMNVFSIHSNRIPMTGVVRGRWYHPGRFFNAALDKASEQNERNALWIHTAGGFDVVAVQIAGLIARRILCYVEKGDPVMVGERYGFIRFGSRVDVYLPDDATFEVKLGQWVRAGTDIIARIEPMPVVNEVVAYDIGEQPGVDDYD